MRPFTFTQLTPASDELAIATGAVNVCAVVRAMSDDLLQLHLATPAKRVASTVKLSEVCVNRNF